MLETFQHHDISNVNNVLSYASHVPNHVNNVVIAKHL